MLQRTESENSLPPEALTTAQGKALAAGAIPEQELDAELAELMAYVDARVARGKTYQKIVLKGALAVYVPIMLGVMGSNVARSMGLVDAQVFLGIVLVALLLMGIVTPLMAFWKSRIFSGPTEEEHVVILRLAASEDVRAVGPMIDYLNRVSDQTARDRTINLGLWQALGWRLQHLTLEQARELGAERHGILALALQTWEMRLHQNHYFAIGNQPVLGMLHVFNLLGQSEFRTWSLPIKKNVALLPLLNSWTNGRKLGLDPIIQQAAAACYGSIQYKSAFGRPEEQLLRASAPAGSGQANLLRPAQGVQPTDRQELLRSTSSNDHRDNSSE